MRIAMIGAGYVGLVSGACFSEFGVDVVCVDKDASKVDLLNNHQVPIYEPELNAIVEEECKSRKAFFYYGFRRRALKMWMRFLLLLAHQAVEEMVMLI